MHPDLIDLGFLHLKTYGACMAVGFILCWTLVERLSGRKDLSNLLMTLMLGGVVGSRLAYVIEHWRAEFAAHPLEVIRLDRGGLMFYGGLILSVVLFFLWCAVKRERPLALADLLCTALPLGHACGRIGCFFYGCCYGRLSDSALAVRFPRLSPAWYEQFHAGLIDASAPASLPVLPTQLFEAAGCVLLFLALFWLYRRLNPPAAVSRTRAGLVLAAYLAGYGVLRFLVETTRADERAHPFGGPLTISQAISVGCLLLAAALAALALLRNRKRPSA